jgi:ABC-type dipeptide/oligopeptide/nickel transport system permease subunit
MHAKSLRVSQPAVARARVERKSLWADVWRQLRRNRAAMLGLIILTLFALTAISAPWIAPHDPYKLNLLQTAKPPGTDGHILGTDESGRDFLSRLIYGARISLVVGLIVVSIAATIGVTLGAIAGYFSGWIDNLIMRVVDFLFAFPFLILAITIVSVLGPGLINMMLVLGFVSWIGYARLVRGIVLVLRESEFVVAARSVGASHMHIIVRHILPNLIGIVIVQATFGVAGAILAAAGLSFLGMGVQPPEAEWGSMLSKGREYLRVNPILSIAPGLLIMLTVLSLNFLGDALRDALDPRSTK